MRLLGWMATQPFEVVTPELLAGVERIVVENHRALHQDGLGQAWSPAAAYHWMRYENPDPIGRLLAATRELEAAWERTPGLAKLRAEVAEREREALEALVKIAAGLPVSTSLPRWSGEYPAQPGEGGEGIKSLPRLSGEYPAEPGEGGEGNAKLP
jgi:hypothetical protein